jgi:protein phosphatase
VSESPEIVLQPELTLLIGVPGSGKTRYALQNYPPAQVISSDAIRALIIGNPNDQSVTTIAHNLLRGMAGYRLRCGQHVVVDATNTVREHRQVLLAKAALHRAPAHAVVLDTPLEECLARNALRPGPEAGQVYGDRVPEDFIRSAYFRLQADLPGLLAEGFTTVLTVQPAQGGAANAGR